MKLSVIRGLLIFAAGAGCATVVAGMEYQRPYITTQEFQERGTKVLAELQNLGRYVYKAEKGHVFIETNPIGQCVPVPPPPNMPYGAVDPRLLEAGLATVTAMQVGYVVGDTQLVTEVEKCKPFN